MNTPPEVDRQEPPKIIDLMNHDERPGAWRQLGEVIEAVIAPLKRDRRAPDRIPQR